MRDPDEDPAAPRPPAPLEATLVQDEEQQARSQERSAASVAPEVPGHRMVRRLGGGAFGEVWLAIQANTGREVAVKFFSRHRGLDWPLLRREVGKLVQVLTERRVVHLLQVGWEADPPYYVMEYLPGGTLADRLASRPLSTAEAVRLFRDVASALVYLHGKAILHCDLKPSNILLDDQGQVRLADFGQARLSSEQGPAAGTLFYMAPELTEPRARPDVRSDIYSLGAVLHTMLVGRPPHATEEATGDLASTGTSSGRLERYRQILSESPPVSLRDRPGIDRPLAEIVERCLRPDPAERFESVAQVLHALGARERRRSQRPLVVVGLLGPLALLIGMLGLGGWMWREAESSAREALTQKNLESLTGTARVTAAALDRNLQAVQRRVSREAEDPALPGLYARAASGDAAPLRERLEDLYASYADRHFFSWVAAGRDGTALGRAPFDARVVGSNYAYREWFTGVPQTADRRPGPPRTTAGLTLAYQSTAAGNPLLVSVAAPLQEPGSGEVVGVLAASLQLDTFNEWIGRAEGRRDGGCPSRFSVLVSRGQLVRHPCPGPGAPAVPVGDWSSRPGVAALLAAPGQQSADFADPMAGGRPHLAAWTRLEQNPDWVAILQEGREAAMGPVSDLSRRLQVMAWIALALGALGVVALWGLLYRATREQTP